MHSVIYIFIMFKFLTQKQVIIEEMHLTSKKNFKLVIKDDNNFLIFLVISSYVASIQKLKVNNKLTQ